MPVSIFSETELARLASFPEGIPSDDLIRAFTLTGADRDLVVIRRGAANRLGLALQLCALRYLGFVPRNLSAAPRSAACFVADQLEVSPDEIQSYARREQNAPGLPPAPGVGEGAQHGPIPQPHDAGEVDGGEQVPGLPDGQLGGLAVGHGVLASPHGGKRVQGHGMARHQGVEEMPQGRQCLILGAAPDES